MIHNYKSCWPTLGPYRHLWGAPKDPFGLKQALTGRKALGARLGARFAPNYCRLVLLGWSHGNHILLPGIGPLLAPRVQKGPDLAQNAPLGGPGGSRRARRGHIWSQHPGAAVPELDSDFGLVSRLFLAAILIFGPILGPTRSKKGTFWAKTGPLWAPCGQE